LDQLASIKEVQQFWDSRPCNIRHSNLTVGTKEYFDEVEERKYFVEPHIKPFADFSSWSGKRVLEVGCGIGTDAINFARSGAIYTGVELSSESLALTKRRFEVYQLEGELVHANCENLVAALGTRTFDLIYSFGVLHHTPSIEKAMSQLKVLSNSSTKLKLMLYARDSWKQFMIDGGLDQPEAQFGCPIANSYTHEEVKKILNHAGFKTVNIQQKHIFQYRIPEYKEYKYVKQPWFANMPQDVLSILENRLGWHLLIDAISM
jgi:SAM-dependent methyltransferase